jgi:hypothetical protein
MMVGTRQMLALEHLKIVHDFIAAGKWESSNASSLGERFSPQGSKRNALVHVSRIWENKDQAQNV